MEDDGIGRKKAKTIKTDGTKEGLQIVQQQLDVFNKSQNKTSCFKDLDLYNNAGQASGTRFELWIQKC